jgi:hypothetical protein
MSEDFANNVGDTNNESQVQESGFAFENLEERQLRLALARTYTERFLVMTKLMKRGIMLKRAKIIHRDDTSSSSTL